MHPRAPRQQETELGLEPNVSDFMFCACSIGHLGSRTVLSTRECTYSPSRRSLASRRAFFTFQAYRELQVEIYMSVHILYPWGLPQP